MTRDRVLHALPMASGAEACARHWSADELLHSRSVTAWSMIGQ